MSVSDGDHSVCAPVGASGGLDDLHRSERSVSSSASSSCFSSLSSLRVQRPSLSIQSAVLWPLHGSTGLHQGHGSCFRNSPFYGVRMRRYLDDWLVQSSSHESPLRDLQTVLQLCHELGIVANPQKSNLVPSQVVQ